MDKAEAGSPELIDRVMARIHERVQAAEEKTTAAARALEASFAGLDERLKATETRFGPDTEADTPERRFERLAAELSEKVEASRTEMAERMREAADGKLDRMEAALRDLVGHVEAAERQSAQAIDRMGREVMRVAQGLGKRVEAVEGRSAAAIEQVGGDVSRIADAMEGRMRSGEAAQAEALEKLGGEIARIAERLAERIAGSERRSATAIEEVGEQVARVTEKINSRYERTAGELGDRIRQSEERTAKLLQEAQEKLDRRLLDGQRRSAIEAAVQAVEGPGARMDDPVSPDELYGQEAQAAFAEDPFGPPAGESDPLDAPMATAFADDGFEDGSFDPGPAQEPARTDSYDEPAYGPSSYAPSSADDDDGFAEPPRASTRDLIEAARAAARQASSSDHRGRRGRGPAEGLAPLPGSAPAPALEEDEPRRRFSGLRLGKKKKKESSTVRTAILATFTASALTATGVGAYLLATDGNAPVRDIADISTEASATSAVSGESTAAEILAPALLGEDAADVTTTPAPAAPPVATTAAAPPAQPTTAPSVGPSPQLLYSAAVRQIESGDATGLDALRRAANMGYAPAQFYLAKLHETGATGVAKDAGEARRWTERAASSGDAKAMHNLGLYYFEGTGGAKNTVTAATWFRRAAEAGLQDSQYNLARLYEQGYGVTQNAAEAYKWYLIAGAGGDAEAKSSAERLRAQLSPDSQAAAQRSAAAYRAQAVRTAQAN
jgi:localization factor PodJL